MSKNTSPLAPSTSTIGSSAQAAANRLEATLEESSWAVAVGLAAKAFLDEKNTVPKKKPRAAKSVPRQTREFLITAIVESDEKNVKKALASGLDPNFIAEKTKTESGRTILAASPLRLAVAEIWSEPIMLALVEWGAQEHLARANWLAESTDGKERARRETVVAQKNWRWDDVFEHSDLAVLLDSQKDPQIRRELAESAFWSLESAKALMAGEDNVPFTTEQWRQVEQRIEQGIADSSPSEKRVLADLLIILWDRAPAVLNLAVDRRWGAAAISNDPRLLVALFEKEAPAPKDGMVSLRREAFPGWEVPGLDGQPGYPTSIFGPARKHSPKARMDEGDVIVDPLAHFEPMPLWTAAVVAGADKILMILGGIPGVAQRALEWGRTPMFCAYAKELKTLKEAVAQGLEVKKCVAGKGKTPLSLQNLNRLSKKDFLGWAALCPEWLTLKNQKGVSPVDFLTNSSLNRLRSDEIQTREKWVAEAESVALKKIVAAANTQHRLVKKAASKTDAAPVSKTSVKPGMKASVKTAASSWPSTPRKTTARRI